jgi:hypothetical protein
MGRRRRRSRHRRLRRGGPAGRRRPPGAPARGGCRPRPAGRLPARAPRCLDHGGRRARPSRELGPHRGAPRGAHRAGSAGPGGGRVERPQRRLLPPSDACRPRRLGRGGQRPVVLRPGAGGVPALGGRPGLRGPSAPRVDRPDPGPAAPCGPRPGDGVRRGEHGAGVPRRAGQERRRPARPRARAPQRGRRRPDQHRDGVPVAEARVAGPDRPRRRRRPPGPYRARAGGGGAHRRRRRAGRRGGAQCGGGRLAAPSPRLRHRAGGRPAGRRGRGRRRRPGRGHRLHRPPPRLRRLPSRGPHPDAAGRAAVARRPARDLRGLAPAGRSRAAAMAQPVLPDHRRRGGSAPERAAGRGRPAGRGQPRAPGPARRRPRATS